MVDTFLLEILGLMHMYIFLWFLLMVKNYYKFSKMGFLIVFNDFSRWQIFKIGFLVVFNVFLIIKLHYFFQNESFSRVDF